MSAETVVYLDSSALVKLIVAESESEALAAYLGDHPTRASSALARVEVLRATRPHGPRAMARARQLLARISLLHLDDALLDAAALLEADRLRSLDAIHIASAQTVTSNLAALVTYDHRMAQAAEDLGLTVAAPA
ncbi:MAG TPA: type II toxin-antitoxin system VapC family toxin [Thermoleophilaceae bacterium]|nr:type II toxin-antitoxin system VapC family toxin [Thermoleophilaceae bacterium]